MNYTSKTFVHLALSTIMVACLLEACVVSTDEAGEPCRLSVDRLSESLVKLDQECRILSFAVDPPYGIHAGDFTFSWETEYAKSVDLEPGIAYDLPRKGSLTVTLYESNWIRLVALGPGGPVEEKLWVEAVWPGGSTWWKEHANESNSGSSLFDGPATGQLYWTRTIGDLEIKSLLVGEDGSIIVVAYSSIHCLSPLGYTKWVYSDLDYILSCAVNPHGDLYAVGGQNGRPVLKKIHPNGMELWEYQFEGNYFQWCSLNIQPQETISIWAALPYGCSSYRHETFIVDDTGTLLTQFFHPYYWQNPSILLGTYFIGTGPVLSSLNFEGYQLWQNDDYISFSRTITTPDGIIFTPTRSEEDHHSSLTAFNANGSPVWSYTELSDGTSIYDTVTDSQGNPYFITDNSAGEWRSLISLDAVGILQWQYNLEYKRVNDVTSLAVDKSGTVYVVQNLEIDAVRQGQLLWKYDFGPAPYHYYDPICCLSMDGTLYVATRANRLFAFRD